MAEVYAFHRFKPAALIAHYELNYDIREAAARELRSRCRPKRPSRFRFAGLGGVAVKDTRSDDRGEGGSGACGSVQLDRAPPRHREDRRRSGNEAARRAAQGLRASGRQGRRGRVSNRPGRRGRAFRSSMSKSRSILARSMKASCTPPNTRWARGWWARSATWAKGEVQVDVVRHAAYALPTALSRHTRNSKRKWASRASAKPRPTYALRTKAAFLEIELPDECRVVDHHARWPAHQAAEERGPVAAEPADHHRCSASGW